MEASNLIRKGRKLLYFKQPESKPLILVAAERKKKGKAFIKCIITGEKRKRLFTVEKLEFMDRYKTESPIEEQTPEYVYTEILKSIGMQSFEFNIEHQQVVNDTEDAINIITDSICISKINLIEERKDFAVKLDVTDLIITLFTEEGLIEILEEDINRVIIGNYETI